MKYKVLTDCFGFRGRYWEKGTVVEVSKEENPPKHFAPMESVVDVHKVPHRTEPLEMEPGKNREVYGGFAHEMSKKKIPRIPTVEDIPNNAEPKPKKKRATRKRAVRKSTKKSEG